MKPVQLNHDVNFEDTSAKFFKVVRTHYTNWELSSFKFLGNSISLAFSDYSTRSYGREDFNLELRVEPEYYPRLIALATRLPVATASDFADEIENIALVRARSRKLSLLIG
jgi:hypothetical protein